MLQNEFLQYVTTKSVFYVSFCAFSSGCPAQVLPASINISVIVELLLTHNLLYQLFNIMNLEVKYGEYQLTTLLMR